MVPRDDRHRPYSYFEDRCIVDLMYTKDPCEWRALPRSLSMPPLVQPARVSLLGQPEDERATVRLL